MYSIHVVCLSVRQTFAYYIPLYNASRFLGSLVVCCAQELSGVSERGLPPWVPQQCCLGWRGVQRQGQQLVGEGREGYCIQGRIQSASNTRALRISPEFKETSKLTKQLFAFAVL